MFLQNKIKIFVFTLILFFCFGCSTNKGVIELKFIDSDDNKGYWEEMSYVRLYNSKDSLLDFKRLTSKKGIMIFNNLNKNDIYSVLVNIIENDTSYKDLTFSNRSKIKIVQVIKIKPVKIKYGKSKD